MSDRVLVPVDGTLAAQKVLHRIQDTLSPESEVIFAHMVLRDADPQARGRAKGALIDCMMIYRSRGLNCRMEMADAESLPEGIVQFAKDQAVDRIVMYTHDADDPTRPPGDRVARRVAEMSNVPVEIFEAHDVMALR